MNHLANLMFIKYWDEQESAIDKINKEAVEPGNGIQW